MKGLSNWRFATRMAAAFGLMIALMMGVAGLSYVGQMSVQQVTDEITERDMVRSDIVYDIMLNNLESAMSLYPIFQEGDPEVVKKYVEPRLMQSAGSTERFKRLDELTKTPEGKALLAQVTEGRAGYTKVRNTVLALLNEGKQDEAAAFWGNKGLPAMKTYREALQKNLEYLKKRTEQRKAEIKETSALTRTLLIGGAVTAFLLAAVVGLLITRGLKRQLGGEPAYAAQVAKRIAEGDLSVEVQTDPKDKNSMLAAMKEMGQQLTSIVRGIKGSSDTITSAASEIAAGNADLSQRTEEQASSLEETASSMEELTGTVKQNAENARQASQLAAGASSVAVKGGEVVAQVVSTMSSINDSSKKIADIIGVIDGIAFQTNILALNAAVEAARAGEQGRGFAVVASEVRTLAQRSAAAAKEIKALITDSVNKVGDGTRLVDQAGKTMQEIVDSVKRVTDIMAEIAAASQEQTSGIEQVNQAIVQMDQATQQNAALVEQAAAAADSMQAQAQGLTKAVSIFKLTASATSSPLTWGEGKSEAKAEDAPSSRAAGQVRREGKPEQTPSSLTQGERKGEKEASGWDGATERRGPNRAKNVARLPQPQPAPKRAKVAAAHDDNDWQEF